MSVSQLCELPSPEIVAVTRQQLWQAGYHCLAVLTQDKRPLGNDWGERARRSPPEVLAYPPVAHALNTGVLSDDLRPLDLDIDVPAIAEAALDLILDTLGDAPVRRRGNSPRCLAVYRAAEGPQRKIVLAGRHGKIEVLGRGQQFVAAGTHPSGAELTWQPELRYTPAADLPAVTEDQIFDLLTALAPLIDAPPPIRANGHDHTPHEGEPSEPQADILRVTAALAAIPNSGPADWEAWNRVGMATWAATGGSQAGWQAWDTWSARNPAYDQLEALRRWEHYPTSPPTRIGAGSLFHMAGDSFRPPAPLPFGLDQARSDLNPAGQPPAPEAPATFPATPFLASEIDHIPRREWIYGHFIIKRFLAVLGAPGGTGKTAYATAIALAVALGEPLLGEKVHEAGPVWLYNLEDPREELLRRISATIRHHHLDPKALEGQLYLDSGRDRPLVIAEALSNGTVVTLPVVDALVAELKERKIKLLIVDPFVKSHRLEENRNDHINYAAAEWSRVAGLADCAILLLHHFRKGGIAGEAAAFRGASALIDDARSAVGLAVMSEEEADRMGVDVADRRRMIRADNAKLNLAPPPEETVWLRLCSVDIGNAEPMKGLAGDSVQAVERWSPPSPWEGMSMATVVRILDKLATGPGDGEQFTLTRRGTSNIRWAGLIIMEYGSLTAGQSVQIIRKWTDEKLVVPTVYMSQKTRKEIGGLCVDDTRLSEMRREIATAPIQDEN